ncbi:hypothetical protein PMAYCL1PPCAC_09309, partial [Pristionchus mayeri]
LKPEKIYYAEFILPDTIIVATVREISKDESVSPYGPVFLLGKDGSPNITYRMCDTPSSATHIPDLPAFYILSSNEFLKCDAVSNTNVLSVRHGVNNVFDVPEEEDWSNKYSLCDSNKFVYILSRERNVLHVIEANTVKFMQPLKIESNCQLIELISVRNAVIYFLTRDTFTSKRYMMTAQLPEGYYLKTVTIDERKITNLLERIQELETNELANRIECEKIVRKFEERTRQIEIKWQEDNHKLTDDLKLNAEKKTELRHENNDIREERSKLAVRLHKSDTLNEELQNKSGELEMRNLELISKNEQLKVQLKNLETSMFEIKLGNLRISNDTVKLCEFDSFSGRHISAQLVDGTIVLFSNERPFRLYAKSAECCNADLSAQENESNCTFNGVIGNCVYFSTSNRDTTRFFRVSLEDEHMRCDIINELSNSQTSHSRHQPFYFLERVKEWHVYQYDENTNKRKGRTFDISKIKFISQHEWHIHKRILYLFRYHADANIVEVNDNVRQIEGPVLDLDQIVIYSTPLIESIFILTSNNILILNTLSLYVTQLTYELPCNSTNHRIVGVQNGILTMSFETQNEDQERLYHLANAQIQTNYIRCFY